MSDTSQTSAFTPREMELLDGMIEVQLHHAAQCDGMKNRSMADKQKGWDMERVQLLQKIKAAQVAQTVQPLPKGRRDLIHAITASMRFYEAVAYAIDATEAAHGVTQDGQQPAAQVARAQTPWGFHIKFNNGRTAMFEGVDKLTECEAFLESDEEITLLFTTAGLVVVPNGYKLVPVNPTPEMLEAADEGDLEYTKRNFGDIQTVMQGPEDHYVAMIAAAPALAVQAVPAASPVQQALLPAGLPTSDELEALSDGNDGMLLDAPFLYKLDLLASWMRKYTTAAQPAPAMQEPVDEYGSTDFGFEIAGVAVTDGDKRLLALLTNAFGNDHPAFDDLTALVLTARSKATPPAAQLVQEPLSELEKDAANLLFALHDAWPYVHGHCTIESKKKAIQALIVRHGEFADLQPPVAPHDAQPAPVQPVQEPLTFNCSAGCGACGVKLQDFVTHQTQAQEGDEWVAVATQPQIVSTCCGSPVEVWDKRKQDITASVDATPPAEPAPCTWSQSTDPSMPDTFAATCGVVWTFTEGGPRENGMHFCPGCGAKVAQGGS